MNHFGMALLATIFMGVAMTSDAAERELKVGDPAPAFALPGSDGKVYKSEKLKGKAYLIAWFPKAFTGG